MFSLSFDAIVTLSSNFFKQNGKEGGLGPGPGREGNSFGKGHLRKPELPKIKCFLGYSQLCWNVLTAKASPSAESLPQIIVFFYKSLPVICLGAYFCRRIY